MYYNILNGLQSRQKYKPLVDDCLTAAGIHSYLTVDEASNAIIGTSGITGTGLIHQKGSAGLPLWAKPFWVTEAGAGAQGPGRASDSNEVGFHVNLDQQADYILQFFALAKRAFKQSGMPDNTGEIMYHRLKDEESGAESTYGLIKWSDNSPWPAYYATWMTSQLLGESNYLGDPGGDKSGTGYKHLIFKGRNGDYIHVLWATNDTPPPVTVTREDPLATHMLMYKRKSAQQYFKEEAKPESLKLVSGAATLNLEHATAVNEIYPIGGETVILVEYRTPADVINPLAGAALYRADGKCGPPDAAIVLVYDDLSGPDTLTVNTGLSSAALSLAWLQPRVVYITTTTTIPPVGATWTYTVTDKAGNETVDSAINNGGPYCPGNDEPDDNFSAASPQSPSKDLIAGAAVQQIPRVALLNRGFAGNAFQLLLQIGEPAMLIATCVFPKPGFPTKRIGSALGR